MNLRITHPPKRPIPRAKMKEDPVTKEKIAIEIESLSRMRWSQEIMGNQKDLVERARYCRELIVKVFHTPDIFIFRDLFEKRINTIFFTTLTIIWELDKSSDKHLCDTYLRLARVLYAKSMDYGPESIYEFGYKGPAIRIATKLSRFINLYGRTSVSHVNDETVEDTLLDILGYIVLIKLANKGEL